jgi:hypothetical protein
LLAGCTAHYQVNTISSKQEKFKLERSETIYIAVPEDGEFESKRAGGSGQIVAQAVANAFSAVTSGIHIAERHEARGAVLAAARAVDAKYVIVPTIASWEQRSTEWSGRPSRIMIRLAILDARNEGDQLLVTSIEGRSRIMTVTSTSPESLLKDPLAEFVNSLH